MRLITRWAVSPQQRRRQGAASHQRLRRAAPRCAEGWSGAAAPLHPAAPAGAKGPLVSHAGSGAAHQDTASSRGITASQHITATPPTIPGICNGSVCNFSMLYGYRSLCALSIPPIMKWIDLYWWQSHKDRKVSNRHTLSAADIMCTIAVACASTSLGRERGRVGGESTSSCSARSHVRVAALSFSLIPHPDMLSSSTAFNKLTRQNFGAVFEGPKASGTLRGEAVLLRGLTPGGLTLELRCLRGRRSGLWLRPAEQSNPIKTM